MLSHDWKVTETNQTLQKQNFHIQTDINFSFQHFYSIFIVSMYTLVISFIDFKAALINVTLGL